MTEPDGTDRGIRAQLNKIVLIPAVTFLVLFVVLSAATVAQALTLRTAAATSEEGAQLYSALVELQRERGLAAEHLGAPSAESLGALRAQQAAVDEALAEVELDDEDAFEVDLRSTLAERGPLREDVAAGRIDRTDSHRRYSAIIVAGIDHYAAHSRQFGDGAAVAVGGVLVQTMRAQETFAQADAVLAGARAAGELTAADQTAFSGLISELERRLNELRWALTEPAARDYVALAESSEWSRMVDTAGQITSWRLTAGPRTEPEAEPDDTLPSAVADWDSDADSVNTMLVAMTNTQARATVEATKAAGAQVLSTAIGGSILALFAGALAYGIASKTAVRLTDRLSRLRRDTLDLAEGELPEIVRRLGRGEDVDLGVQPRRLDYGGDEIGQVADAFNTAQRTAVAAAVRQVEIREGANRVFLALAHRDQSLLQRQLRLLDRIEREEEDPDLLEDLFHLDHLATRGRRNAENLIILAGGRSGRRWRSPIPLVDVLRSAVSEVEEYARITVLPAPDRALRGEVVADVIHLFAELVENAARYSPPYTRVEVHSEVVPRGLAVEISDQGLGMSEESLAEANERLATVPEFDVVALDEDPRLGLFVVARLAARYDIQVRLCAAPYGGTRAVVLIPNGLVVQTGSRTAADEETGPADDPADDRQGAGRSPAEEVPPTERAAPALPEAREPGPPDRSAAQERPDTTAGGGPPAGSGAQNGADSRPPLPRRRRQTHLAPPLRDGTGPEGDVPEPTAPRRTPEEARRMMEAFHSGTRRGRRSDPTQVSETVSE
ncbi:sensor histidine kinase [Thermobifida halotolerans]|uniref:histidine kinase n=1 Tax=Thermobifida halotolerans TaxID=483545 RepID=A0A399G6K0_9ACTN|nr:nitrate- and nitrite sensing domain-containing protein [Thermobifida halotolerans]UOE17748.1 sensor histidine kinase [Thermobifida halotolerans]